MPRTTIEEVAAAAGVSRSTVSRVVNGSTAVSPETSDAVRAAIARLDYMPNRAARSLASRQTHSIALIVPEDTARFFADPFFAAIMAGIAEALARSEYLLTLLIADDTADKMVGYVRNGGVDGALIVSHHAHDAYIEAIADAVPTVFGGRPARVHAGDYVVDVDNVTGGRTAARRLIGLGRTRVAAITGPRTMPASVDRLRGWREALSDAGLEPFAVEEADYLESGGEQAMARILATGIPDAVVVGSDLMARGAVRALRAAHLRVPEDVAVVGYDDSPVAVATDPPLTTIRQPLQTMGATMADVLLAHLGGGAPDHETILPTELVVRASG